MAQSTVLILFQNNKPFFFVGSLTNTRNILNVECMTKFGNLIINLIDMEMNVDDVFFERNSPPHGRMILLGKDLECVSYTQK